MNLHVGGKIEVTLSILGKVIEVHEKTNEGLSLRAAKAIPTDEGQGRARLPLDDELKFEEGDIVEIEKERKTVAIASIPIPLRDSRWSVVRIDRITRENAGVDLGDWVQVRKAESRPCERMTLAPIEHDSSIDREIARDYLVMRPFVTGDRVILPESTSKEPLKFEITETTPDGIVQIRNDTQIIFE